MSDQAALCGLCERSVPRTTVHHLLPRSVGRRQGMKTEDLPTALLCDSCHRQLHVLFDNGRLAKELHTIEAIRAQPEVGKFLDWLRKQPIHRGIRVKRRSNC